MYYVHRTKFGQLTVNSSIISESPPNNKFVAFPKNPKSSPKDNNIVNILSKNANENNSSRINAADDIASIISNQQKVLKSDLTDNSVIVSFKSIDTNSESKIKK